MLRVVQVGQVVVGAGGKQRVETFRLRRLAGRQNQAGAALQERSQLAAQQHVFLVLTVGLQHHQPVATRLEARAGRMGTFNHRDLMLPPFERFAEQLPPLGLDGDQEGFHSAPLLLEVENFAGQSAAAERKSPAPPRRTAEQRAAEVGWQTAEYPIIFSRTGLS